MKLQRIGSAAQAVITDPLIGSASGYALVAASPGVSRTDADQLERQPLVSDYLHLLEDQKEKKFFAFHPLPSGAWALTQRFLSGQRRGSFNRVVVHALLLSPELLAAVEDPRSIIAHGRFDAGSKSWVQLANGLPLGLGADGGVAPLADLELSLPVDIAELRLQQILSQLETLRREWGDGRLQQSLVCAFTVLSGQQGRLLLEPSDELFLAFLTSVLPAQDRLATAWASQVPPEAFESFRLVLTAGAQAEAQRLPAGRTLDFVSSIRVPGAEALAELVLRPAQLEDWLRRERAQGASLTEGRGQLAAQVEYLLRGETRILEGFADFAELKKFFARVGPSARAAAGKSSWQEPAGLLGAVAATLLRQLDRARPEALLRAAFDLVELAGLADLLFAGATLRAFLDSDPGQLGQEGKTAAIGLALLGGELRGPDLDHAWRHFPARLAQEPTTEELKTLWRQVFAELVTALVDAESPQVEAAIAAWAAVRGLEPLVREVAAHEVFRAQLLFSLAGRQGEVGLQRLLAEKVLAPALVEDRAPGRFDPAWTGALARILAGSPALPDLSAGIFKRLAGRAEVALEAYADWIPGLDHLEGPTGPALVQSWLAQVERLPDSAAAEDLLLRLQRLAGPSLLARLQQEKEKRRLALGRSSSSAIFEQILRAAGPGLSAGELARQLLGKLSNDRQQRLRQGLELLADPALPPRSKWLLEDPFLAQLLEQTGAGLAAVLPPFATLTGDFGLHAQMVIAAALGRASRGQKVLPGEFLLEALRAERMDLAGAFLRAAGGSYLLRLDPAIADHHALIRRLRAAWDHHPHRFDLVPFGRELERLRAGG